MKKKNLRKNIQEKMIMDVLDDFNFRKVHDVMGITNWKWACRNGDYEIPSLYEMIKTAEQLLRTIIKNYGKGKYTYVLSGGFKASLDEDDFLMLEFIAESSVEIGPDYEDL